MLDIADINRVIWAKLTVTDIYNLLSTNRNHARLLSDVIIKSEVKYPTSSINIITRQVTGTDVCDHIVESQEVCERLSYITERFPRLRTRVDDYGPVYMKHPGGLCGVVYVNKNLSGRIIIVCNKSRHKPNGIIFTVISVDTFNLCDTIKPVQSYSQKYSKHINSFLNNYMKKYPRLTIFSDPEVVSFIKKIEQKLI